MNPLRPGLPALPPRMKTLPVSPKGYPVPFFVAKINGEWDFQVADPAKREICVDHGLCWVCGQPMGVFKTFVLGPMAAMNGISAEPPSHLECAEFSVAGCPFLALPKARRGSTDADKEMMPAGGVMMLHNPGVMALWTSKKPLRPVSNAHDVLLKVGEPTVVRWFASGQPALREVVLAGIDAALDRLRAMCRTERELAHLDQLRAGVMQYVPREMPAGIPETLTVRL